MRDRSELEQRQKEMELELQQFAQSASRFLLPIHCALCTSTVRTVRKLSALGNQTEASVQLQGPTESALRRSAFHILHLNSSASRSQCGFLSSYHYSGWLYSTYSTAVDGCLFCSFLLLYSILYSMVLYSCGCHFILNNSPLSRPFKCSCLLHHYM